MAKTYENALYQGDNLEMLRKHVASDSVDLVYLDPPFNSDANYNMLFAERDGSRVAAQIKAFSDTWTWDAGSAKTYDDMVAAGGPVAAALQAFRTMIHGSDMLAYLSMMAPRLVELRRVIKPTGSLYLHCDPTASHYLKLLLDAVFGPESFRNEIVWKRTSGHNDARRHYADAHDTLLFYSKGPKYTFNRQFESYSEAYIKSHYANVDAHGRQFTTRDLRSPHPRPNLTYEYKGYKPHANGWSISIERMEEYDRAGLLHFPADKTGRIRLKRYLDEMPGTPLTTVWTDIEPLNSQAAERIGYPTQKPAALLERIIETSSNEGDVVLDPFCGCGTAVAAAQDRRRRWIGIDITSLAIGLIEKRLIDAYGPEIKQTYRLDGAPTDAAEAARLARVNPMAFQDWIVDRLGGRPGARGADGGIDGKLSFRNARGDRTSEIIISVKSGRLNASFASQLLGVVTRESAAIGVLVTLYEPTPRMKRDAADAGFVETDWGRFPKLQLLTVADMFAGRGIHYPQPTGGNVTFKRGPKAKRPVRAVQQDLLAAQPLAGTALSRQIKPPKVAPRSNAAAARKPTLRSSTAVRRSRSKRSR